MNHVAFPDRRSARPPARARSSLLFWLQTLALAGLLGASPAPGAVPESDNPRQSVPLDGDWLFRRDASADWKTVQVPSSFQAHEGTEFHGVGWYRRAVAPLRVPPGYRVLLHFQAAATEAEVWWNDQRLGTHLGGWTPFRFDVTELAQRSGEKTNELRVRLDEKVGHNTQGFLPIVAPHFGGLWQGVRLLLVPETYCDDLEILAVGEPDTGCLRVEAPLTGTAADAVTNATLRCRLRGEAPWTELSPSVERTGSVLRLRAPIPAPRRWSPADPALYEVELALPGAGGDRVRTRAAFRSIEAFGQQIRLNGQPLSIRGLLNWGYAPPLVAPNPGEAAWRSEIEFARTNGFNLMKFCLWVPPARYLELADESGMLTWMEYPTWHPTFTGKFLEPLRREFREFFRYDRNSPSIVLRSLTCETGPSAELAVIRSLYEAAHEMIPGALIEDDSSWIGWNRVHDFYDDHPYGNNHTWVKTLAGFNEHILGHGLKPLVLGETTAADTWVDRDAVLARLGQERPWWAPGPLDDMARWTERISGIAGPDGLDSLRQDSLHYGLLMRKFQIEAFRREIPYGGYVISVIRDIPNASMGLLDYLGRPKWTPSDWSWHQDTLCLLKTDNDRRSFTAGDPFRAELLLSHFGSRPLTGGRMEITLTPAGQPGQILEQHVEKEIEQNPGTLARIASLYWPLPGISAPTQLMVRAELNAPSGRWHNQWPVWVVPASRPAAFEGVRVHSSLSAELQRELFPRSAPGLPDASAPGSGSRPIVVAAHFDEALARFLQGGGRVLLLPDGQAHSLPRSAHWFLRGAPYIPAHPLARQIPRELFLELQHFDLAADVVPSVPQLDSLDPILMLWDTHDQKTVRTHGVLFETRVGQGRMLVSAARHGGTANAAGRWLLGLLLEHLRSGDAPRHALPDDVTAYLTAKLNAEQTNLVTRAWRFQADPANDGLARGWHRPQLAGEEQWKEIRIGAWWESQGYAGLDGWAWYRLWVDVPQSWQGREVYLSFEGVDDIYELYVNGELAGKGGDLATRKDALSEKKSHPITRFAQPGQKALIAVRVHDWYGAGGIFRPVTLGTLAFSPGLDFLK